MQLKEKINTNVVHSQSNNAWNVIGTKLGSKYKIARVPYIEVENNEILTNRYKAEALEHALFISYCFNNSDKIK